MGFDKVIDSAQLETALTASADAIRKKTGRTDPIKWSSDTGFADAIKNIEANNNSNSGNSSNFEYYDGEYEVTPSTKQQTLETESKVMRENVIVEPIPYSEVSNGAGGTTVTIGG